MKMTSGWMRAGAVAAMMVAAGLAGAQTTAAHRQAQSAAQQVNVRDQAAAQRANIEAEMAGVQAHLQAHGITLQANSAAMEARIAAQEDVLRAQEVRMQAEMYPMMAKMEVGMVPMQAALQARSAAMQAHMMARGLMLQDGMVTVGDPQVKDDLFAGTEKFAKGASDVTDVNLGPDMLGMVSGKHGGDMAHKLNFMVVRTYEYPHEGMYSMADVDAYRQKLRSGNWNCFVHTYESKTGESTDICNRALPNGQGNEMVIMTVEPKELTFIHMSGKGSLADLSRMGRMGGMGGAVIPDPPDPPTPPVSPHQ